MVEALPLALDDETREAIDTAFDSGNYITVGYVDADGWAHVSRRGTTQVLDPQTLALWVRKPDDGLAVSITERPHVTLYYVDLVQRGVVYTFYGNAHVSDDPEVADRVWSASPERERAQDAERRGVAVIVELERVVARGRRPDRNFVMQR
jgi:hypothetical protein